MLNVAVLPGDGIGPEVIGPATEHLKQSLETRGLAYSLAFHAIGGAAIDQFGDPLPQTTLRECLGADAVLLGAVGGPRWDHFPRRPEQGLLELRQALGLYANIRPVTCRPGEGESSALKADRCEGVDMIIVRELTGGLYFGERGRGDDWASDECRYSEQEILRVARVAFELASQRNGRVTSVDKANVLATSKLWREVVSHLQANQYPHIELTHEYVDAAAMKLVTHPKAYDVILTENMFGDILSDVAAAIPGSIGKLGSVSIGDHRLGLFEPIHGSAPDIAGKGLADPAGALASVDLLLSRLDAQQMLEGSPCQ